MMALSNASIALIHGNFKDTPNILKFAPPTEHDGRSVDRKGNPSNHPGQQKVTGPFCPLALESSYTNLSKIPTRLIDIPAGDESIPSLLLQICKALEFLHDRNITHGSLNTSTILVEMLDGKLTAKIPNFDTFVETSSKCLQSRPHITNIHQPEIDMWAFALIMVECLTTRDPVPKPIFFSPSVSSLSVSSLSQHSREKHHHNIITDIKPYIPTVAAPFRPLLADLLHQDPKDEWTAKRCRERLVAMDGVDGIDMKPVVLLLPDGFESDMSDVSAGRESEDLLSSIEGDDEDEEDDRDDDDNMDDEDDDDDEDEARRNIRSVNVSFSTARGVYDRERMGSQRSRDMMESQQSMMESQWSRDMMESQQSRDMMDICDDVYELGKEEEEQLVRCLEKF